MAESYHKLASFRLESSRRWRAGGRMKISGIPLELGSYENAETPLIGGADAGVPIGPRVFPMEPPSCADQGVPRGRRAGQGVCPTTGNWLCRKSCLQTGKSAPLRSRLGWNLLDSQAFARNWLRSSRELYIRSLRSCEEIQMVAAWRRRQPKERSFS